MIANERKTTMTPYSFDGMISWEPTIDSYTTQDGTYCEDVIWESVGVDYDGGRFVIFEYENDMSVLTAMGGSGPNIWDIEVGTFRTFTDAAKAASSFYADYLRAIGASQGSAWRCIECGDNYLTEESARYCARQDLDPRAENSRIISGRGLGRP